MFKPIKVTLKNNLSILMDYIPHVETVSLGLWSKVGSRVETSKLNGMSHFLEHMVFKGTTTRDFQEISNLVEDKGGYLNAWTSKERTSWYAKLLKNDVEVGIDLITDIIHNSTFPKDQLEKERNVVIEEINMYNDVPSDIAYNLLSSMVYKDSSLGRTILGPKENILSFSQQDLLDYKNNYYAPSNLVFGISGNFNQQQVVDYVSKYTENWNDTGSEVPNTTPAIHNNIKVKVKENIEQSIVMYSLPAVGKASDKFYKMKITAAVLLAGMSSRLFMSIREEHGLAYFVRGSIEAYLDCGTFIISSGCSHKNISKVIELIKAEITKAINDVKETEITKAKYMLKSSLIMSLEDPYNRANKMASDILSFNQFTSIEETVAKIDAITKNDVVEVLSYWSKQPASIAIVTNEEYEI